MKSLRGNPLRAWRVSLAAAALTVTGAAATTWAAVTDEMIAQASTDTHNILIVGMGQGGQRYSTLSSINSDTIGDLLPTWAFSFGGEKQRGQEGQALVHDGIVYITASYSRIFAMDAKTGEGCGNMTPGCRKASCPAAT